MDKSVAEPIGAGASAGYALMQLIAVLLLMSCLNLLKVLLTRLTEV